MEYLIEMKNITKSFGEVVALDNINFGVGYNEIVGLLGDNGAGKSTLIKILNGYNTIDSGEIYFKGRKLQDYSVAKARKIGIETVYQERALSDQQTLWSNIFMGREIFNKFGFLNIREMKKETSVLMRDMMGFTSSVFSVDSIVENMSGGERQGVAIARALFFNSDLIILDEPTMSLSLSETKKVIGFIKEIKKAGKSCIFIDHNIYHIYPVVERICVMDRGKIAGEFSKENISMQSLIEKMFLVAKTGKINNEQIEDS